MEPCPLSLDIAIGGGLDAAVQSALEIGPASRALEGHPPETRAAAIQSIREMLTPFAKGDTVPLARIDLDRDGARLSSAVLWPVLPRSSPDARWSAPPFPCPDG